MSDDESQPKDRVNDSFSASDAIQDPQDGNEFANDFDEPDLPPLVRYPIHLGPFRYIHFPSRSETSLQTRLDAIFVAVMQLIRSGKKIHASHLANELLPYFSQHPMPIYAILLLVLRHRSDVNKFQAANFFSTLANKEKARRLPTRFDPIRDAILLESIFDGYQRDTSESFLSMLEGLELTYKNSAEFQAVLGMVYVNMWLEGGGRSLSAWLRASQSPAYVPPDGSADGQHRARYQKALTALKQSLAIDPSKEVVLYHLVLLYIEEEGLTAHGLASNCLDYFIRRSPLNPIGHLLKAKLLHGSRPEYEEASAEEIALWKKVLALDPINDTAFISMMTFFSSDSISCSYFISVLIDRMDMKTQADERAWALLAFALRERALAILTPDTASHSLGSIEEQKTMATKFYTWPSRYWSLDALSIQQEEFTSDVRVSLLVCSLFVVGKTPYSLNLYHDLYFNHSAEFKVHLKPFEEALANLLEIHKNAAIVYRRATTTLKLINQKQPLLRHRNLIRDDPLDDDDMTNAHFSDELDEASQADFYQAARDTVPRFAESYNEARSSFIFKRMRRPKKQANRALLCESSDVDMDQPLSNDIVSETSSDAREASVRSDSSSDAQPRRHKQGVNGPKRARYDMAAAPLDPDDSDIELPAPKRRKQ